MEDFMKAITAFLTCFLAVFWISTAAAQDGKLSGRVLDGETNAPLAGATVLLFEGDTEAAAESRQPVDPKFGRVTNREGDFEYDRLASGTYTLRVTYIGFRDFTEVVTIEAGKDETVTVALIPDIIGLQEVVVSGVASRTQKEVAEVAVSRLNASALTNVQSYNDIGQLLSAKVPGVRVTTTSGNVGGDIEFDVRSGAGLFHERPVIYVDGVRVIDRQIGFGVGGQYSSTLTDINPQYIQNIEVLKGPAASALYGTSGANGVILISTKKGSRNMAVGEYTYWYRLTTGWNEQMNEYTEDYARSYRDANATFREGGIAEHSIGMVGNAGLFNYFLAYENRSEDGIQYQNSLQRNAVRANFSAFPSDKVSIDVNANYTFNNINRPQNDNNILGALGNTLLSGPVDAGGYGSYAFTDSAAIRAIETASDIRHFTGSLQLNYAPFDELVVRGVLGYDALMNREDQTFPQNLNYTGVGIIKGSRSIAHGRRESYNIDLSAAYSWEPLEGLNALSTLGFQGYQYTVDLVNFDKMNFPSTLITNIGAGLVFTGGDEQFEQFREAGIFFQQDFNIDKTYFFSAGVRNDYVSSVGVDAPSIFYPRFSAAVRLDKLDFLPSSINFFKARAAYGESGILPGLLDGSALRWAGESSGAGTGAVITAVGNAAIEPERTKEIEIGLEAEYDRSYGFDLSYYWKIGSNEIITLQKPPSTGLTATTVPRNVGSIDGWGFESHLYGRPIYTPDVQLNVNLIYNYANNEVTDLGGSAPIFQANNAVAEGYSRSAYYLYAVKGALFDEQGVYAGPDVDTARSYIGTPVPPHSASLGLTLTLFRDLTITALFDGAWGGRIRNYTRLFSTYYGNNLEYATLATQLGVAEALGVVPVSGVTELQPGSDAYRAAGNQFAQLDPDARGLAYFEESDFFRIREISVRYDLTSLLGHFFDKRHIRSLALILAARNLYVTTKYSGPDPEVTSIPGSTIFRGDDFLTLQNPRVYTLTFSIGL